MGAPFVRAFEHIVTLDTYADPDYILLKGFFKRRRTVVVDNKREERLRAKKVSLNSSLLSPLMEGVGKFAKNE
jgi:hypothetical protein